MSFQRSTSYWVMACPYPTLSWARASPRPTLGWPMTCPPPTLSWLRARQRPTLIPVVTGPRPTLSRVVTRPQPISSWTRTRPRPTPCWVKDMSAPNSTLGYGAPIPDHSLGAVTNWPNSSWVQRVSWTQLFSGSVYRKLKGSMSIQEKKVWNFYTLRHKHHPSASSLTSTISSPSSSYLHKISLILLLISFCHIKISRTDLIFEGSLINTSRGL
jgi:hypothetical protein